MNTQITDIKKGIRATQAVSAIAKAFVGIGSGRKANKHKFWGAGEPDCPSDIKAPNGELHTMRCKVCGEGWRESDQCSGNSL